MLHTAGSQVNVKKTTAHSTVAHMNEFHHLVCRYLVEAPPNVCTPTHLAQAAARIAESASDVMALEVLEKEECEKLGMGLYLAVAACSAEPPKFIHLTYKPKGVLLLKFGPIHPNPFNLTHAPKSVLLLQIGSIHSSSFTSPTSPKVCWCQNSAPSTQVHSFRSSGLLMLTPGPINPC